MKLFLKALACLLFFHLSHAQGIAINEDGSDPDPSALLDIRAVEKGMLAPRMSTSQRTNISSPAIGLIVFDTDKNNYFRFDGAWEAFEITTKGTLSGDVPTAPAVGDSYYDETGGIRYVYTTGGWAAITASTAVDSPYGTIDMVFGTASGNSVTITSWNTNPTSFDGYVIIMNSTNSFTDLATNQAVYPSASYASNGQQVIYSGTTSSTVAVSVLDYEKIYYFKMVPYSVGTDTVYDNSQSPVFVTTSSCTFLSGTDTATDIFTSSTEAAYTTYHNSVASQVCFSIDFSANTRTISSNQWPDHYMGDAGNKDHIDGKFPVAYVLAEEVTRVIELNPTYNATTGLTYVYSELGNTRSYDFYNFGIATNGVEFHPMGVTPWAVLDAGGVATGEENWGWQLRVVFEDDVNLDPQGGHTTSRGEYHYHGDINAFASETGASHSKIYGYAADGFPIYYKYGYQNPDPISPNRNIIALTSSYRLRTGSRSTHPNVSTGEVAGQDYPGGNFEDDDDGDGIGGTYIQDYEYVDGLGDLDECNGRYGITPEYPDGTYYYVITAGFPITPNCFVGTPNADFLIGN